MKIDDLRLKIRVMTRNTALYKALKEELSALGYWRNKARGNPSKGHQAQQDALSRG
jgi:hypothetical protein